MSSFAASSTGSVPGKGNRRGTAVILLNYCGWRDTLSCVDSLLQDDCGFYRLIVCENGSPDDSLSQLAAGFAARHEALAVAGRRWGNAEHGDVKRLVRPEVLAGAMTDAMVTLIDNQANLGFAAGNNSGLQLALRDPEVAYFWLLNNDTEVLPSTLGELLTAAERRPDVGLWGATVLYHGRRSMVQALGGG